MESKEKLCCYFDYKSRFWNRDTEFSDILLGWRTI